MFMEFVRYSENSIYLKECHSLIEIIFSRKGGALFNRIDKE